MLNVGVDYWQAEGVQRDLAKAYMWLDLARFYTQAEPCSGIGSIRASFSTALNARPTRVSFRTRLPRWAYRGPLGRHIR